ncbi:MAG: glycosyltransferase family 2 protein [Bacteroidaceae bacterium]|nr:glycosyltransferase family 2 protein [Bacteroidaceae bacterium]
MKTVSIIIPAYNEAESFPLIVENMQQVLEMNPNYNWEFLLVNDGSTDATLECMINQHTQDSHFSYLDLSRNYGKEIAMMAGLDYINGDAVIFMDADMQHPINVIPEMLQYWEEGYNDVYAQRRTSKETWVKKKTSQLYYRILQDVTSIPIQIDTGDFRLLDSTCIDALRRMRETERNTKGMCSWIGFHKKGIYYDQKQRVAGKSKWNFLALLNLALNGLTSYTTAPLRIASILGGVVSVVAFIYLLYIMVTTLVFSEPVQGFPTIMITILFLGGIQLLCIGIIGEYLGKVFKEVKNRPGYFVNSYNGERP